jgi:cytidylate kinase
MLHGRELQLAYLDTGALYRATALRVVNKGDAVGSDGLVVTSPDGTVAGLVQGKGRFVAAREPCC